jgi:hypothetical protein
MERKLDGGTLIPAYGRDYPNMKAAKTDFLLGKDFELSDVSRGFGYCSIRDFEPGAKVCIRYDKNRKQTFATVPDNRNSVKK